MDGTEHGGITVHGNQPVTFSFLEARPAALRNPNETALREMMEGFSPLNEGERQVIREAIGLWDDVVSLTFKEVTAPRADLLFANTTSGADGVLRSSAGGAQGPLYVFENRELPTDLQLQPAVSEATVALHAFGHILGFEHADLEAGRDSQQFSVMSLDMAVIVSSVRYHAAPISVSPQTPMVDDIKAAQALYGVDTTTRVGDTTYGFNSTADRAVYDFALNKIPFLTIWDAGGHDTLDLSGWGRFTPITLDLNEGAFSSAGDLGGHMNMMGTHVFRNNIGIAYGTIIEDGKTGLAHDTLIGNAAANRLDGGGWDDTIYGGAGDDVLIGGSYYGRDVLYGGPGADTFLYASPYELHGDQIMDFEPGVDRIDISSIDAIYGNGYDTSDDFTFVEAFTGRAGEAVLIYDALANVTRFQGDLNGDGAADFTLVVNGEVGPDDGWVF